MTKKQIAWASRHDWFIRDNGDGSVTVLDNYTDALGANHSERLRWSDGVGFAALRAWAGY